MGRAIFGGLISFGIIKFTISPFGCTGTNAVQQESKETQKIIVVDSKKLINKIESLEDTNKKLYKEIQRLKPQTSPKQKDRIQKITEEDSKSLQTPKEEIAPSSGNSSHCDDDVEPKVTYSDVRNIIDNPTELVTQNISYEKLFRALDDKYEIELLARETLDSLKNKNSQKEDFLLFLENYAPHLYRTILDD